MFIAQPNRKNVLICSFALTIRMVNVWKWKFNQMKINLLRISIVKRVKCNFVLLIFSFLLSHRQRRMSGCCWHLLHLWAQTTTKTEKKNEFSLNFFFYSNFMVTRLKSKHNNETLHNWFRFILFRWAYGRPIEMKKRNKSQ